MALKYAACAQNWPAGIIQAIQPIPPIPPIGAKCDLACSSQPLFTRARGWDDVSLDKLLQMYMCIYIYPSLPGAMPPRPGGWAQAPQRKRWPSLRGCPPLGLADGRRPCGGSRQVASNKQ